MLDCFTRNKPVEIERILRAQDDAYNEQFQYAVNSIKTSKYNFLTFLPKNLFEQFTRIANAYFLFLLILQLIPVISSLTFVTTVIPLVVVLSVTALKDLIDDIQRHRSDRKINNRKCHLVRAGRLEEVFWKKVKVGNVLKVSNNELIPADLLLLTSSEASGIAFVETADLDGESNLKNRQSVPVTSSMENNLIALTEFNGEVECEPPNNRINDFQGRMTWKGQRLALNKENILLRGCALRNTTWIFGVVLYAGKDSKLMMNCGKTTFKRTHIDRLMNQFIIKIFFFLILVCLVCSIGSGVWESQKGFYFQTFLPWPEFIPGGSSNSTNLQVAGGATLTALLVFLSYVILFNTLIPISLYVSVEIIRFTQSWWINWDLQMTHDGISAKARTTALNEELGQIQFIFSDKTGTLTQNMMCFKKCSINGKIYSEDEHPNASSLLDMSEKLSDGDEKVVEFFRLMSTCHTVLSTMEADKLVYQAQSPDESALVEASKKFGVVFLSRTHDSIIIKRLGNLEDYQLLHILDFDNDRKRMSVILKRDNKVMLYCKGADSKIIERLKVRKSQLVENTESHLDEFAAEGLRTLCLACRELGGSEFDAWEKKFQLASTSMKNRNEMLNDIYDEIECDLDLLGATAIEDKLQGGVAETIENLRLAGIRIWVLTGDKQETAVNIGFSCKLLTEDLSELFVVDGETEELVDEQLHNMKAVIEDLKMAEKLSKTNIPGNSSLFGSFNCFLRKLLLGLNVKDTSLKEHSSNYAPKSNSFAIVINGDSLTHALSPKLITNFINIGCLCTSLICCRVTPLQKAKVVEAVKSIKKVVTLAVGDGANDVSMIKTAHIGVGISGQEGMQAVISSDYSMAQFRFLERLLLVHGRWSYLRMSKFLRYFFYKNFTFTFCQFWFAFYSGFSAQTIYDPFFVSLFNLAYTSLPIIALGVFDQDVSDKCSHSFPKLYHPGPHNLFFSAKLFALSAAEGVMTSLVIYYVTMVTMNSNDQELADVQGVGFTISSAMVVVVTFRCSIETSYWTHFNHLVTWGSLIVFFIFHLILYLPAIGYSYSGTFTRVTSTVSYWSVVLLSTTVLILPVTCYRVYESLVSASLVDRIRELRQKSKSLVFPSEKTQTEIQVGKSFEGLKAASNGQQRDSVQKAESPKTMTRISRTSLRSSVRSRSSYAFSQEEGIGRLITSGRVFKRKNQSDASISG